MRGSSSYYVTATEPDDMILLANLQGERCTMYSGLHNHLAALAKEDPEAYDSLAASIECVTRHNQLEEVYKHCPEDSFTKVLGDYATVAEALAGGHTTEAAADGEERHRRGLLTGGTRCTAAAAWGPAQASLLLADQIVLRACRRCACVL